MHLSLDRILTMVFGGRIRQSYILMSYRIKTYLFPEYGAYIPRSSEISPTPNSTVWMPPAIPSWVLDEMKELACDIDPLLYPTDQFLANCRYYSFPVISRPGEIYWKLLDQCTSDSYSHCFAIPWLKRGGADLVILRHLEIIARIPNCKVLVILTEPGDSPWLSRIPVGVDVINASCFENEIAYEDLLLVLVRILIQLRINTLHIINSRHVWDIVCRYGLALSQQTHIFASIYCDDFDRYGQPVGFARQFLPNCYRLLTRVFSDNQTFPKLLCDTYGYRSDLFQVLKSPIESSFLEPRDRTPKGKRVLWAGRLDRQKRPDLLLAVAKALPDVEFHVYGDSILDIKIEVEDKLRKLKNVYLLGSFDGVERLPFSEFPVFLYTSQWDGTPTMIIAAAAASIPIVATCVGGVGSIVTELQGYPVFEINNVALYVARIEEALNNPLQAEERAKRASKYVRTEYTDTIFAKTLASTPGYMPSSCITNNAFQVDI